MRQFHHRLGTLVAAVGAGRARFVHASAGDHGSVWSCVPIGGPASASPHNAERTGCPVSFPGSLADVIAPVVEGLLIPAFNAFALTVEKTAKSGTPLEPSHVDGSFTSHHALLLLTDRRCIE